MKEVTLPEKKAPKMTAELALKELKVVLEFQECNLEDAETNHLVADMILTELLKDLGYIEIVAAYDEIDKWYA